MPAAISVIIATFNRGKLVERTLPTVLAQELAADFEVIVVDDGSNDNTSAVLVNLAAADPRLRVLRQENVGQPAARNAALAHATGGVVLFLDDDIVCPPTLVAAHLASHAGSERRFVFGTTLVSPESPRTLVAELVRRGASEFISRTDAEGAGRWPDDALMDANVSIPRDALGARPFDENVPAFCANTEVALRLTTTGALKMHHAPSAVAEQIYEKSSREFCKRDASARGRSEVLLARKMPEYRPHSGIGTVHAGRLPKRSLRLALVRCPLPLDILFLPLLSLCSVLGTRGLGARLVAYWSGMETFRAAVRECGGWTAFRHEFGRTLPVLMYHHIGPLVGGTYPELTVLPEAFEKQMQALRDVGFQPITVSEWRDWCCSGTPLPAKPVLLTFDDAYADLTQYAFPILQSLRFPALVFVVTDQIGGTNTWDEVRGAGTHRLMTANSIREWSERGVEFLPHSHTHADLPALDTAAIARELDQSRTTIQGLTGRDPIAFAYPYGLFDDRTLLLARQRFACAFTTKEGI
ncbi:MAG: hypothetical protein JWN45_2736, partial [Acidobacteriaceae bacterium]|nr:hypothetical protein [Acidobacteriaceae bacterium]